MGLVLALRRNFLAKRNDASSLTKHMTANATPNMRKDKRMKSRKDLLGGGGFQDGRRNASVDLRYGKEYKEWSLTPGPMAGTPWYVMLPIAGLPVYSFTLS